MQVYIQTDIEGIAGFCFFENRKDPSIENFHHRERMRRLLTGEVNSAVKAAFDAGADSVLVNDNHGCGYNILFEELDPRCRIIHGRNCSGPHWLPLLERCDCMILIGMHAAGGTPCAITPHSRWVVNDEMVLSEGSMASAIAGDLGIPTLFVSGDDKVVEEISGKIPGIKSVVTKEALSPYQACSLIPAKSCEMIYHGVLEALRDRTKILPCKIPGPVKLTLMDSNDHAPPLKEVLPPVTSPTITEAFFTYEKAMEWTHFDLREPDGFVFP